MSSTNHPILNIQVIPYRLPFHDQLKTSQVVQQYREGYWVILNDGSQYLGVGDIAPWEGFGSGWSPVKAWYQQWQELQQQGLQQLEIRQKEQLHSLMTKVLQYTTSQSPVEHAHTTAQKTLSPAWHILCQISLWVHRNFALVEVRHAVELAILDLCAQHCQIPVARLLCPQATLIAKTHALINSIESALQAIQNGYQTLKLKVGVYEHWSEDARLVEQISKTLPSHITLRMDANRAWSPAEATHFVQTIKNYGVDYIEEPIHVQYLDINQSDLNITPWKNLSDQYPIHLAVDESIRSEEDFQAILTQSYVKTIVLKPMFVGGLIPCLQRALKAYEHGIEVCVTHALDSAVGRRGAIHLAAVLSALGYHSVGGLGGGLKNDVASILPCVMGEVTIPPTSGLGVNAQKLLKDGIHPCKNHSNHHIQKLLHTPTLKPKLPHDIVHPLHSATLSRPQHIALQYIDPHTQKYCSMNYLQLYTEVAFVASALYQEGIRSHHRIGIQGEYTQQWLILCLAFNWLGCTIAPIKYNLSQAESMRLNQEQSLHTIYPPQYIDSLHQNHSIEELTYIPAQNWSWEQTLFVIQTSGTSNQQTQVELTAKAMCMSAFSSAIRLGHMPNDCWLACLPLHHVGGLSIMVRCLLYQTSIFLAPSQAPKIIEYLHQYRITLCSLTPSLLAQMIDHLQMDKLQALRLILLGGAATPHSLWQKAKNLNLPIRLTWGMSEAASQICTQTEMQDPQQAIPPMPFMQVCTIVDQAESAEQSAHIQQGQLTIYTPTANTSILTSNDYGSIDTQGHVKVLGRLDDQIISGGVNITPSEIEQVLDQQVGVIDQAVVGIDHALWGQRPVAFIIPSVLKDLDEAQFIISMHQWVKTQLSAYKCPSIWVVCKSIPRNHMGKLQRTVLKSWCRQHIMPYLQIKQTTPSKHTIQSPSPSSMAHSIYYHQNYFSISPDLMKQSLVSNHILTTSSNAHVHLTKIQSDVIPFNFFSFEESATIESEIPL